MRNFFIGFTVVLILIGFVSPIVWVGAIITGILAVLSRPPGLRPDGKPKSGGAFGGIIDSVVISKKMKDCPYCKSKIMKDASKCPNCGEWLIDPPKQESYTQADKSKGEWECECGRFFHEPARCSDCGSWSCYCTEVYDMLTNECIKCGTKEKDLPEV